MVYLIFIALFIFVTKIAITIFAYAYILIILNKTNIYIAIYTKMQLFYLNNITTIRAIQRHLIY
jgi:hypothetical protein